MNNIAYIINQVKFKILRNNELKNNFFRRKGVKIGKGTLIYSNILSGEPYLIEIGSNCVVSVNVTFITHDYAIHSVIPNKANLFGKIVIGNNCFIGERSTILYGCELGDEVIVAAGSVVTKSFKQRRIIIGGNPARIISSWDKFAEKSAPYAVDVGSVKDLIKTNPEILVKR